MKRPSQALESFTEELKREAKSRNSQHARDVHKLKALIREAESMLKVVENAKWSLKQPESISEIDNALKSGWETTIRKYEQLVEKIRFEVKELEEPLPAFLEVKEAVDKPVELQSSIPISQNPSSFSMMPYNVSYLRLTNLNYWTQDVTGSEQAICVPPDSRLATRLCTYLDNGLATKLQADSKLLWLGKIAYSDYVKRFWIILETASY